VGVVVKTVETVSTMVREEMCEGVFSLVLDKQGCGEGEAKEV
jgi:hypothetical protein